MSMQYRIQTLGYGMTQNNVLRCKIMHLGVWKGYRWGIICTYSVLRSCFLFNFY